MQNVYFIKFLYSFYKLYNCIIIIIIILKLYISLYTE